jgi:ornithine cyclodeaminase/alanine dehydrogenase-like protein (mu-crystallin family)
LIITWIIKQNKISIRSKPAARRHVNDRHLAWRAGRHAVGTGDETYWRKLTVMPHSKLIYLSAADVRLALPMSDAVDAMKQAFAQLSAGQAIVPQRIHMPLPHAGGDVLFMPAAGIDAGLISMKIITLFEGNHAKGLPFIQAIVTLLDGEDGRPLAIMDGASLTAIRTGAASGAATDLLARADAESVAIFGAGAQAKTQLEAVCAVRNIVRASVFDQSTLAEVEFESEMSERLGIPVTAAVTPKDNLAGADIVCTATTSETPVFDDADLEPGTHVNAVGSYKPHVQELPAETVVRARLVVDETAAILEEAGDLLIPIADGLIGSDHIYAEIGQIVSGQKAGRQDDQEITLFKSVGVAIQDLAAAGRILANARRDGLGIELQR